jgi:hypothetical protein
VRLERWHLAALGIALLGAGTGLVLWLRSTYTYDARRLMECLPSGAATRVYLDIGALRKSGLLDLIAGSKTDEEADYKKFVAETGFDYTRDLDAAAVSFGRGNVYMALRGRFKWKQLRTYAASQGGTCNASNCYMPASQPGRFISFYEIHSHVMALAVTPETTGVSLIGPGQWKIKPGQLPGEPLWLTVPSFEFADPKPFPEGTHAFLSPLAQAQDVTFAVGASQAGQFEVRLTAACESPATATQVHRRLTAATELLTKMIARENLKPNPHGLSGLLVAGNFQLNDRQVTGRWPLDRQLVETLASGKSN